MVKIYEIWFSDIKPDNQVIGFDAGSVVHS
jgi:hypothetical protein